MDPNPELRGSRIRNGDQRVHRTVLRFLFVPMYNDPDSRLGPLLHYVPLPPGCQLVDLGRPATCFGWN